MSKHLTNTKEAQAHETDAHSPDPAGMGLCMAVLPNGRRPASPQREDYATEEAYDDAVDEYLAEQALRNPRFEESFKKVFGGL